MPNMRKQKRMLLKVTPQYNTQPTNAEKASLEGLDMKTMRPVTFPAKFLFSHKKQTIGPLGLIGWYPKTGMFASSKITVEIIPDWTSSFRFETKLIQKTPSLIEGVEAKTGVLHEWVFWINSDDTEVLQHPIIVDYPKGAPSRDPERSSSEALYKRHNILEQTDDYAVKLRKAGRLCLLELHFRPSKAQTRSILIETPSYLNDSFQKMHDDLRNLFSSGEDDILTLRAFVAVPDQQSVLSDEFCNFKNAMKIELAKNPIDQFFLESRHHKRKIDSECMTKRAARPQPFVPYNPTFRNQEQFFTIEGFAIQQAEEHQRELCRAAGAAEAEVRVLQFSGGSDKVYIAFVRLGDLFEYRLSSTDSFEVTFNHGQLAGRFVWKGQILDQVFPCAATYDVPILLFRKLDEDKGWDKSVLGSILDCRHELSMETISEYCHKDFKNVIRAIRQLNPAHSNDKLYADFHCPHWETILLGQDLRANPDTTIDLFDGLDVPGLLKKWQISIDKDQEYALLKYFRALPHRLGMGTGCFGSGKTMLDVIVAILLIHRGLKVDIYAPNNLQADSFLLKLQTELSRLEAMGMPITDKKLVRYHSPTTEKRVVEENSMRFRTKASGKKPRWQAEEVTSYVYDQALQNLSTKHYELLGDVDDRRYKLDSLSLGTLLLKTAGLFERKRPSEVTAELLDEPLADSNINEDEDIEEDLDDDFEGKNQDFQRARESLRVRQDSNLELTEKDRRINWFKHWFLTQEKAGSLEPHEREYLINAGNDLMAYLLENEVCCLSTTLTNAADLKIQKRRANHRIVQEAFRASNGELYIALANTPANGTIHLSGDPLQITNDREDIKDNNFANYANNRFFQRMLGLGYPAYELKIQYRTIPVLSDIVSNVFYRGKVRSAVDVRTRPYAHIAQTVLKNFCGVDHPVAFLAVNGQSHRAGATRSKVNPTEASIAHNLVESYIKAGIPPSKVAVISGYHGHKAHVAKAQAFHPDVKMRDHLNVTTDQIQGEEVVAVIFCLVGDDRVGHMKEPGRLLVPLSRGMDSFVGIMNWTSLSSSENGRSLTVLRKLRDEFIAINAWVEDFTLDGPPMQAIRPNKKWKN